MQAMRLFTWLAVAVMAVIVCLFALNGWAKLAALPFVALAVLLGALSRRSMTKR